MRHRGLVFLIVLLAAALSCTRDPEVAKRKYVAAGNKYFNNGKYREASIMYRNALRKDAHYGEAYYRLALTELKLGRYTDAVRALRRSIELDPKNTDAHARLADIYLAAFSAAPDRGKNLIGELKDLGDSLLKQDPRSFQGLRLRGYHALYSRDIKLALASFRAANEVQPFRAEVVIPLIQVLILNDQFEEGETLARSMIERDKATASAYDILYMQYVRRNRIAEAEDILKLKILNNPARADFRFQLAAHYYAGRKRPEMLGVLKGLLDNQKQFTNAQLLVGDFYARIREFEEAILHYREGERGDPKQKPLYRRRMAEALVASGRKAEAAQLLDNALKENPKDNDALGMRAALLLQTGDRQQVQGAINDLQLVLRRTPDNPVLRFELGRAYVIKGETELGRLQFEEAMKLRPDYIPPRLALAQLHLKKGEFPKTLEDIRQILQLEPSNIFARLIRSSALIGLGDGKQARLVIGETLKMQPGSRDAQFQLGMLDFSERQFKLAEETFRKLYQMTPPDPRGLIGMVEVAAAQGQFNEALKLLELARAKSPDRPDLTLAAANVAVRAEKYDFAIREYKNLVGKFPDRFDLYLRLGETYRRSGQIEAAIASFDKARALAPNDPAPHLQAALLLEGLGQREKARPIYEQILKIEPDNPIALNNLAYLLAETGANLDQALTMAQRAKQKMPQEDNVADTLGWIYIKKNLSDNAVQIFRELVRKNPSHPTYRFHLAMALFQKGDKPQAKKELDTALRSKPSKEDEAKIRELMARIG